MGFAAALIPAATSIVGGLLSKKAKGREAASLEAAGAKAQEQLQPFAEAGADATGLISNVLAGGRGSEEAFRQFQEGTGFQSQLREGSAAITGNAAARGLLGSGSTLKRLTTFGQERARQSFGDFTGLAERQAGRGVGAATSSADVIMGTGEGAATARGEGAAGFQSGLGAAAETVTNVLANR